MRAAGWLAAVLCPLALLGAGSRGLRFHPGQGKGAATKEEAAGGCRGAAEGAAEREGSFWRALRLVLSPAGSGRRWLPSCPGRLSVRLSVAETLVKRLSSYEIVTPVRVNEFGEAFPHTHHFSRRRRSLEGPPEPAAFRTHYQLAAYGQVFQLNLSADAAFIAAQYTTVHVGAPQEQETPDLRHCFYRGHVNAQEAHMAVFSICGGLVSGSVAPSCLHSRSFPSLKEV